MHITKRPSTTTMLQKLIEPRQSTTVKATTKALTSIQPRLSNIPLQHTTIPSRHTRSQKKSPAKQRHSLI